MKRTALTTAVFSLALTAYSCQPSSDWSLLITINYIDHEQGDLISQTNLSDTAVSYPGYTDEDYLQHTRREASCEGSTTEDPSWSQRVSILYENQISMDFVIAPYTVDAHKWRHHEYKWTRDVFAETHESFPGSVTYPPNWSTMTEQQRVDWFIANYGETLAARVDLRYIGTNRVIIEDAAQGGGGGGTG